MVGHIAPEAQVGGPIALLREGDMVTVDTEEMVLSFDVSEEEDRKTPQRVGSATAL